MKTIMFLKVKKETTLANVLALFVIQMCSISAHSYTTRNMQFLLASWDHFDIKFTDMGTYSGKVLFWALIVGTILTPVFGYSYDIFGRKWLIICTLIVTSLQMSFLPAAAPNLALLIFFRIILVCC